MPFKSIKLTPCVNDIGTGVNFFDSGKKKKKKKEKL